MPPIDFTPDAEPIAFTPDGAKGTVDFQPDAPAAASISRPAPDDSLADQFKGVGQAFQRGVTSGLRAVDVLGELTDRRVPTARQGRAAFERAMQDPRYMAQLSEASRMEIEDPAAGKKRAAQAEDVFGPAAKLEQIRRPIVTEQEARRFDIANASEQLANAPRTQAMQRWEKADNSNWWQVFAADPVEITANIIAESFPQSAIGSAVGGALGAQLGAPGMAAGVGAGSFATEYANSLLASAGEAGFDLTKPEAVKAFFASPQALADAKAKAMARGVPIAVMDAATAGLAGKFLGPTLGKGVRQVAMGTAKEIGMQMAGGMAGELGAQVASGEPIDFKEIAAEGIGELGGAPAEAVGNIKAERARQAVPKTGTAQPPVTPDVTPPAPEQPKVEVTRDLAKELQAALTGNQGKATPVTPDVTPPAPAQPAGPLRFRAIVEEGKVPSELVIQPLTEELYDAVIHVEGLTPDWDQFKAENPDATHLKRQLLPTGKFASGHKFGPLNELVPPGIGSQWEDITNLEPSTKNQAPPAPTSPPPPAAAVPPPAAPAPPAPAAAVSPAPATAQTPQALPSSPAGDSLAAPLTPPAPGPGAPAQSVAKQRRRNPAVEEIWKKYSETGEIETARDLADALDGVEKLPAPLTKAVRMFRKAIQDDVKEFGQRSGLEDQFANQLESVVEKYVAGTPAPPAAVEQERKPAAVDVSTIEQATTEPEMYKATGALLTAAKTEAEMAKIRAAQRRWIEQREAAALTPPAPAPTVTAAETETVTAGTAGREAGTQGGKAPTASPTPANSGLATEPGVSPGPTSEISQAGRTSLGKAASRVTNGRYRQSTTTDADGLLHTLGSLGLKLPYFKPDRGAVTYFEKLTAKARRNEPLTPKEKAALERFRRTFPVNFEDNYGPGGEIMEAAYQAAQRAGLAVELFTEQRGQFGGEWDTKLDELRAATGKNWTLRELFEAIPPLAEGHRSRVRGETSAEENAELDKRAEQDMAFQRDQNRPGNGTELIPPDDLREGMSYTLDGRKLRVTDLDIDEDGRVVAVELEDGDRYGTQRLTAEDGSEVPALRADQGSAVGTASQKRAEQQDGGAFSRREAAAPEYTVGSGVPYAGRIYRVLSVKGDQVQIQDSAVGGEKRWVSKAQLKLAQEMARKPREETPADELPITIGNQFDRGDGFYITKAGLDIGEGPFDTKEQAAEWAEAEVFGRVKIVEVANNKSGDIRNSRAEAAAEPAVSVASAQARADELTAKWVLPFGVEVVQSWRDLPARARRGITEQDGHTVEGRYVPGSGVFLVADNLASADRVAAVVLHEVLGHFGIDTVLASQRDAFMLDVFRSFQGTPLFQQKVRDYAGDFENGRTPVTQADKILLGRELVAALAENPAENPTLWQRIVDAVRRWLRDIGWVQDVTEADIREALRRADRELRGVRSEELGVRSPGLVNLGGGVLMTPGAQLVDVRPDALAALTAHHGTPHKVDKFTTAKIGTGEGAQVYGWGLYFAENPQVAKTYADTLGLQVKVKGQQVYRGIDGKTAGNAPISSGAIGLLQGKDWNLKAAQEEATARAAEIKDDPWFQKLADELQTIKEADIEIGGGATYTVTLNVEPEDLLDWDKPLSEQSEKVRKAFNYRMRDERVMITDLDEIDNMLSKQQSAGEAYQLMGEAQDVSNHLASLGIKGIRYLDQGSRGIVTYQQAVRSVKPGGPFEVYRTDTGARTSGPFNTQADAHARLEAELGKQTYNYVIFNEDDIRITHENGQPVAAGQFSRLEPRELSELGFYDTILEALKRWQPKGTPEQLMAHLGKTRGALEQAEWIGLPEFLKGKPTVTNAEVAQFTRDNAVEVREVVKGSPESISEVNAAVERLRSAGYEIESDDYFGMSLSKAGEPVELEDLPLELRPDWALLRDAEPSQGNPGDTKFGDYQLPGGENYRELLLTLPEQTKTVPDLAAPVEVRQNIYGDQKWYHVDRQGEWGTVAFPTREEALAALSKVPTKEVPDTFNSSHFDEPNILAHVRFNERTDAQGRRVLFIEEVQSDWHKEGRKGGYRRGEGAELPFVVKSSGQVLDRFKFEGMAQTWADAYRSRTGDINVRVDHEAGANAVPDAPFKGTWPMLVMKRMLRWAAENNFDSVAWITGDQTAERYDLSKQVDRIEYGGNSEELIAYKNGQTIIRQSAELKELPSLIGKDAADKVASQLNEKPSEMATLEGEDLKVGGDWARSLYDRTLPNEVNKFVKKWGGRVERAEIDTSNRPEPVRIVERTVTHGTYYTDYTVMVGDRDVGTFGSRALAEEHAATFKPGKKSKTVHSLTLTPDLKDAALGGMPLFARTVQPEPRESDDLPKRVGTRNASGENATEDALRDQTVINVAALRKDPKLVAKVEALIRAEYPQLRLAEGQDPIEALTQFVENNLIWLHNQMDPEVRARAKLWYDGARKIVLQWEQQYGRPREAVAAVIAKLSPQRDWFQNLELAERVIAITNQLTGDEKLTDEMDQEILSWIYKKPTAKQVETPEKKARFYANQAAFEKAHFAMRHVAYRDMNPWQKAVFVRAYSSTALPNRYNIWTPEGERLGFKYKKPETKTKKPKPLEEAKLGWPGFDTIAGAISILENPTLQNISDTLGNEHKIRNFYNNIILPNSEYGDVTIDTHAVAAGQLKALAGDDMEVGHNFGTGAPSSDVIGVSGLYAIYADAYRRAAAQLGLQPRQLQSITWEEIRALFTEEFKAQEANKQLVENVWQRYAAGNLTLEEARNEIKALATDSQPDWVGVQSGAPATATPWTLPDRGQLSGARRYFEPRPRQRRSEEFAAALNQAAARRAAGLSPFSRTTQPNEPLPDLLARRDDAAARGITYAAQREKLRSEGKTIPESLKKAEREQAEIFKEAQFQLLRHPDYVAQQVRAVDAKLDELNTLKERQRILKQQGTDLESDARARLADLEQWLPIETGEIPYGNADEFVGIPPSLVKQAIERTSGLKHFVTEAEKERVRAILDNPDLSPEQKDRLLADLERNRGRALAEVPLPNALPPRANVALATSTTLAGNQDARTWWESFARWARNLASATPDIPLFGPLARLNVPMRGFLNAIRAGNMTAARDAEAMVQDVVQPLLALPRTQLDPNALARHQAIARKLQAAERQFDQQAERMRAEIAAMEQMRADRSAITERREALAEFEGNPPPLIAELQKQLAEAVDKLGTNPMWLFKQAVLFRDYVSRFQMLAPKQQGRFKFPGNLSIQDVVNELERTNAAIEASPARAAIKEAMDRHYRAMAELEAELLKRGHIIPEAMKNGAYFPHQVLDYTSQHLGRLKPATEAPFRGYLVDPTGSRKAIETDYIQAVYRHAAEVMAHNSHQDAVEQFLKPWDKSDSIRETVAAKAAAEGRTAGRFEWRSEDNLPPGYVFYDAAKKLPLRLGYVMDPQTIADALGIALKDGDVIEQMRKLGVDFVVEPEMLQQALVAGEKQPWVIPKEMAEALDGILERQRQEDAIARAPVTRRLRQAVALWKLNTLFAPWHYIRYEWGNTMSDLVDKLGGADPGMAKYLPQAFKEVIAFADKKEATPEIRAAFEQRVLDTITFAEVEKVKDSPAFEQLRSDTQRALGMVGTAAKNVTFPPLPIIRLLSGANVRSTVELSRLREATFRYAKFLADLNRIRNGERPVYAGAYWKDVEAERTPEEKAAFIARRTFGDYGDLSVAGEYLRRNLVPFWSWTEINFRYHVNLLRNMADMIRKGEFGDAAQSARAIAAWTALRLALPYAAVHLWNTVGGAMAGAWDDDDDLEATLSDADRRRFHLILGKDERGQTKVIYMPTAFSDVVSWFGGDNAARLLAEYARGEITFERVVGDFAKQIGPDTLNKVAQSTGPIGKGAFIAVSGKQPFPDITNMRSVGGREKWFAVVQTMTDREGTDLLRRAFDNDYYPRPAVEVAQQLILQIRRRDPEQWAFYEVKEKVSQWKEQKTGKRFEAGDYQAPEAQALRGFRRAVYLGDVDAADRFYNRLLGFGYTSERLKASIRNQHPLAELNEEGRKEFIKGLSRADREQLRRALQYWERLSTLKGKERGLFPAKPGQRFTPQPDRLRNAVESFERRSDEDVERTARRLMDAALTGRK